MSNYRNVVTSIYDCQPTSDFSDKFSDKGKLFDICLSSGAAILDSAPLGDILDDGYPDHSDSGMCVTP